jgi:hypothetical protein
MALRASLVVLVVGALVLAGCGGSGRLSASKYRAKLAAISRESSRAQTDVEKGLHAKSVKELQARMTTFANAEQQISNDVRALKPPKDAQEANAELAVGAQDTAKAAQAAANKVGTYRTVRDALAYLSSKNANAKGAHELDDALAKLKALGYTTGS